MLGLLQDLHAPRWVCCKRRRLTYGPSCRDGRELKDTLKRRIVVSDEKASALVREFATVLWGDLGEEVDVLVGVEARHFFGGRASGALRGVGDWWG